MTKTIKLNKFSKPISRIGVDKDGTFREGFDLPHGDKFRTIWKPKPIKLGN